MNNPQQERIAELEALCAELRNALADANAADAAAEAWNDSNFADRRREFDELIRRARMLLNKEVP